MKKKCYTHLSHEERETLSVGLAQGHSIRTMATVLGRAPSTLSRESARNATKGHPYRACTAHTLAAPLGRDSRGGRANSWIPGCGGMSRHTWSADARPNRLPVASVASILRSCGNVSRLRLSMWPCTYCPAALFGANCWVRCGRPARPAGRGRGGEIGGARFPT
jgi:hypothetical protein